MAGIGVEIVGEVEGAPGEALGRSWLENDRGGIPTGVGGAW